MTDPDANRQRKHDEQFQRAVLDALDRMHRVLHDISDAVRAMAATESERSWRSHANQAPTPIAGEKLLLTVAETGQLLGMSKSSVYALRYSTDGPTPTKVGSRLFFQRADLVDWLARQREEPPSQERPWSKAWMPGRVGSTVPASSERRKRDWCSGSHQEPMAASRWTGRGVCRACRDDVMVNTDGRLRKHFGR